MLLTLFKLKNTLIPIDTFLYGIVFFNINILFHIFYKNIFYIYFYNFDYSNEKMIQ